MNEGRPLFLNYRRWCPMRIASWSGRRRIRRLRGCRWLDLIAGRSRHSSRWKRRRNCWGFESGRREWADDGGSSNGRPSSGTCNCPARDSGNCTRSPWWWVSGWLRSAIIRKKHNIKLKTICINEWIGLLIDVPPWVRVMRELPPDGSRPRPCRWARISWPSQNAQVWEILKKGNWIITNQ